MREQDFQNRLLVALSRELPVRVWRQNSGTVVAARGGAVKGAPKGACDITGYVIGAGTRLEIECKAYGGRWTEEQRHWSRTMRSHGVVYAFVMYVPTLDADANLANGVRIVREAIEEVAVDLSRAWATKHSAEGPF